MATIEVVTPGELKALLEWKQRVEKRLQQLESLLEEWVSQTKAMKVTGLSKSGIIAERKRPETLLVYKMEGETGKKPVYFLKSLIAYNDSKTVRRHRV
ncbi:hypothetical protein ACD591_16385 [Rufibacter glacialis]|uniref:Uncharacterized protein n=1 Tax=Rufibacter glacialis TaxID=1259555 RepID=A0A5M8QR10_9BACT|nr:hypothetical protein [Rufibacter glacialis]KAA6437480.1 hypothetical protein FOE74_02975 [Rufibacter glacialis]GGK59001.1 hypothetical protein GCM10011405_03820 [Rufibacter glacialis]